MNLGVANPANAVAFDANNGQLEVVPQVFTALAVFPFDIVWLIAPGDVVTSVNTVLGKWKFPNPSALAPEIVCPFSFQQRHGLRSARSGPRPGFGVFRLAR